MRARPSFVAAALAAALTLTACPEQVDPELVQCELDLALTPDVALPGDEIRISGRPASERVDTDVRVDGQPVAILAFDDDAADCGACEACRDDAFCNACEPCPACAEACAACVPSLTFAAPEGPEGLVGVTVANRFGTSAPLALTLVLPPPDDEAR
jgi:hypothetical protein